MCSPFFRAAPEWLSTNRVAPQPPAARTRLKAGGGEDPTGSGKTGFFRVPPEVQAVAG